MYRKTYGFTLIELLIVFLVIAVLAGIALPLYLTHAARAQFSEAHSLLAGVKPSVHERLASGEPFSSMDTDLGVRLDGTYGEVEDRGFNGSSGAPWEVAYTFGTGDTNAHYLLDGKVVRYVYDFDTQLWRCVTDVDEEIASECIAE